LKLLLDENLSPRLVAMAAGLGIYAFHAAHVGLQGRSDPDVFRYAFNKDAAVVTANAGDYITLARRAKLHAGLIALRVPSLAAAEQWDHLCPVLKHCLGRSDPAGHLVNHVIEIWGVGRFQRSPLPR